jgi:hypothetical protein
MCFGILGGVENSWECLISGPCIHELSDCLDDAPSMHAVMTAACLNILAEQAVQPTDLTAEPRESSKETTSYTLTTHSGRYEIKLLKMPSGNWRIISAQREDSSTPLEPHDGTSTPKFQNLLTSSRQKATIDALIRQFVPAPIVEELDTATGLSYFAEIREVVTMFMKVSGDASHVVSDLDLYFANFFGFRSGTHMTQTSSTETCWTSNRASTRPSAFCTFPARTCVSS